MLWRASLGLQRGRIVLPHAGHQPTPHFFKRPPAGEEENTQADEAQRAAYLVEDVAVVEPRHRNGKADHAQVDQRLAGLAHTPPDDEDAESGHECMGGEIWFVADLHRFLAVSPILRLGPDT